MHCCQCSGSHRLRTSGSFEDRWQQG